MKLNCKTTDLKKALSRLAFLPGTISADIISANLFIVADFDGVTLKRRSTSATLSCNLECDIIDDGEAVVPFEKFKSYIGNASTDDVTMIANKDCLNVECGAKGRFIHIEGAKFTKPVPLENPMCFKEQAGTLAEYLSAISMAYGTHDQGRPALEGLIMQNVLGRLWLCACDGRRGHAIMTQHEVDIEANLGKDGSNALMHLAKLEDESEDIKISVGKNTLAAQSVSFLFTCALGEEKAPNVAALMRKETEPLITIPKKESIQAVCAAAAFTSSKYDAINFEFSKKEMVISRTDTSGHQYEKTVKCQAGKPMKMRFNWDYFTDALAASKHEEVIITHVDEVCIIIEEQDRVMMVMCVKNEDKPKK